MPETVPPPPDPGRETNRGVVSELLNVASSFGQHLQGLVSLASLESKEAAGVYLRALIALVVALVLLAFGYLLTLLGIAFVLAHFFHISWIWISLGLAALHFLGVGACVFYLLAKLKSPVFTATSAELKRDLDGLRNFQT